MSREVTWQVIEKNQVPGECIDANILCEGVALECEWQDNDKHFSNHDRFISRISHETLPIVLLLDELIRNIHHVVWWYMAFCIWYHCNWLESISWYSSTLEWEALEFTRFRKKKDYAECKECGSSKVTMKIW